MHPHSCLVSFGLYFFFIYLLLLLFIAQSTYGLSRTLTFHFRTRLILKDSRTLVDDEPGSDDHPSFFFASALGTGLL